MIFSDASARMASRRWSDSAASHWSEMVRFRNAPATSTLLNAGCDAIRSRISFAICGGALCSVLAAANAPLHCTSQRSGRFETITRPKAKSVPYSANAAPTMSESLVRRDGMARARIVISQDWRSRISAAERSYVHETVRARYPTDAFRVRCARRAGDGRSDVPLHAGQRGGAAERHRPALGDAHEAEARRGRTSALSRQRVLPRDLHLEGRRDPGRPAGRGAGALEENERARRRQERAADRR